MDDVYEVDNRYPEVAEPYEKIRGGRHYGRVGGTRELAAAERAGRSNSLKRSFWTAATAAVTALIVLFLSPGWNSRAAASGSFEESAVSIVSTAQSDAQETVPDLPPETAAEETVAEETVAQETLAQETETNALPTETETETSAAPTLEIIEASLDSADITPLSYRYAVKLNSAAHMRVSAKVTSETGATLGSDGPYMHNVSQSSPLRRADLNCSVRPDTVTLTLTGTYTENGKKMTVTVSKTLEVPQSAFTAPTLEITEAALNGTDVTPLSYRYAVTLNSAERMQVSATITSGTGASLGADGPYTHTASETSPLRSAALSWSTRPDSVILTLTGTYTRNGEEKTVTATRTLQAAEQPFTAPTLVIADASLNGTGITPLQYSYQVTLNSAERMQVSATITSESGASLGADGPYTHTASGTSPTRSTALSWSARPKTVILTLTGTYTERGTTKTVTATRTLSVQNEQFVAPAIDLISAERDGRDSDVIVYNARIMPNSGKPLTVYAVVSADGTTYGTAGPFTFNETGSIMNWTIRLSGGSNEDLTLTLTGSYELNGITLQISDSMEVGDGVPFEAPEIELQYVQRGGIDCDEVRFSFSAVLNSASKLRVRARFFDEDGNVVYESFVTDVGSGDRFGPFTFTTGAYPETVQLVGEYEHLGTTYTVYDSAEIPMDTTFSVSDDPTGGGKIPNDPCNFQEQALRLTR